MKTVAVDCSLNFPDNDDGTFKCLGLGDSIGSFAYHPDLQKDIQETEAAFVTKDAAAPLAALAPPAAALPPAALPPAAPAAPAAAPKPKLKGLTYKKKDYRYVRKIDEATGAVLGFLLYDNADLLGEAAPIGFIQANPKGLPSGDILPVP